MAPKKEKRKLSKSETESSSSEEIEDPKPKDNAKKKSKKDEDEEPSWHLGNKRFVKVRSFKGKLMVDVREFYEKDGELMPGKKGISLQMPQWKKFLEFLPEIEDAVKDMA